MPLNVLMLLQECQFRFYPPLKHSAARGVKSLFMIGKDPPAHAVFVSVVPFLIWVYMNALVTLKCAKNHVGDAHSVGNILWNIAFLWQFYRFSPIKSSIIRIKFLQA